MSDSEPDFDDPRFLVDVETPTAELSYLDRRKRQKIKQEDKGKTKSRKQREEEQREKGLQNDLVKQAQRDGEEDNKAFKMMKAMGYRPGNSLGKQSEPSSSRAGGGIGFAKASFAPTSADSTIPSSSEMNENATEGGGGAINSASTKRSTEPIKFEMRTGRTGLGIPQPRKPRIFPSSTSNPNNNGPVELDETPLPDLSGFLQHIRSTMDDKRAYGILRSCRRTLEELDRKVKGLEESCMWRDPDEEEMEERKVRNRKMFERIDRELDQDRDEEEGEDDGIMEKGLEERIGRSELNYVKGISVTVVELEEEERERERQVEKERIEERERIKLERRERQREQEEEEEEWFAMDVKTRLALTLSYLRNHYHYCFWCGCQYNDQLDLDENCTGTEEDDH